MKMPRRIQYCTALALCCPFVLARSTPAFAADAWNESGQFLLWGLFFWAALTIFGLYQHKRGKITVFANYTDILCTILAVILAGGIAMVARNYAIPQRAVVMLALLPIVFVATATFAYNRNIFGFLLSLCAKFSIVIACAAALMIAVCLPGGSEKREKGESVRAFEARQKAAAKAAITFRVVGVTGVFATLVGFCLRDHGFVPLRHYFTGTEYILEQKNNGN